MSTDFQRHGLAEGVNLYLLSTPKFKTTAVYAYFHQPLAAETVTANAMVAAVLGRGSADHPTTAALTRHLDEMYGADLDTDVLRRGETHSLVFRLDLANEKYIPGEGGLFARGLQTLAGIITRPALEQGAFRPDYVAQEAANLRQIISGLINEKRRYAIHRCIESMCQGEAFALHRYGRIEDLDQITPAGLFARYRQILSESPVDIFVVGDVAADRVIDLVAQHLTLPTGPRQPQPRTRVVRTVAEPHKVEETQDITQGVLAVGLRTGISVADPDYYAMVVANGILGGYSHSKLFQNVREKASLAYYASSMLESVKGIAVLNAGIEFANYQRALDICLAQLEDLVRGQITDTEFDATVKSLVNDARAVLDSPGATIANFLEGLAGGREIAATDRISGYQAVTREQAAAAAGRFQVDTIYFLTRSAAEVSPEGGQ